MKKHYFVSLFLCSLVLYYSIPFGVFASSDVEIDADTSIVGYLAAIMRGELKWQPNGVLQTETPVDYYTQKSFRGSGARRIVNQAVENGALDSSQIGEVSEYADGNKARTSFISQNTISDSYNTYNLNIPTEIYNTTTNNYYNQYDITNISYNETYNIYNVTTNNYNYYINYSPTYVTVINYVTELNNYNISFYYYQLPDGRNSYDLVADDVWGTVFSYDVVNCDSVPEDDNKTLLLMHFDGDIKDSSSHNSSVQFTKGASTSYVESTFGGALCMGNLSSLVIALPESLSGDFTIEARLSYSVGDIPVTTLTTGTTSLENFVSALSLRLPENSFVLESELKTVSWNANTYTGHALVTRATRGLFSFSHTALVNRYVLSSTCGYGSNIIYSSGFSLCFDNIKFDEQRKRFDDTETSYSSLSDATLSFSRKDGVISTYLNGLLLGITVDSSDFGTSLNLNTYSGDSLIIDELRVSNFALYAGSFYAPSSQPFDTNNVFVLPASGNENDIAVKGFLPVNGYRIGGVRPTYPTNGYVYISLSNNKVESIQQYQSDGWYEIDGAVFKNGKWVDAKKFDLSDAILDEDDFSGSGSDSGGDGGSDGDNSSSGGDGNSGSDNNIWDKLLGAIGDFFGGFIKFLVNIISQIVEGVSSVFSILTGLFTSLLDFASGGFTSFMGEFFAWLPPELISLITLSLALSILFAIIRFFWR